MVEYTLGDEITQTSPFIFSGGSDSDQSNWMPLPMEGVLGFQVDMLIYANNDNLESYLSANLFASDFAT